MKIYAFLNRVCSVRIIIMRMQQSQNEKLLEEVADLEEPTQREKPQKLEKKKASVPKEEVK